MRAKIQAKVAAAFNTKLSDAVTAFTGSREVVGEYSPITGQQPIEVISYQGRGVFGSFKAEELTQHILATDTKLTALQNELLLLDDQGSATTTVAEPRVDDEINGQKVVVVMKDPAGVTWSLALRRT